MAYRIRKQSKTTTTELQLLSPIIRHHNLPVVHRRSSSESVCRRCSDVSYSRLILNDSRKLASKSYETYLKSSDMFTSLDRLYSSVAQQTQTRLARCGVTLTVPVWHKIWLKRRHRIHHNPEKGMRLARRHSQAHPVVSNGNKHVHEQGRRWLELAGRTTWDHGIGGLWDEQPFGEPDRCVAKGAGLGHICGIRSVTLTERSRNL
jgi:hypothetical protein